MMKTINPDDLTDAAPAAQCKPTLSIDIFGPFSITCTATHTDISLTDATSALMGCLCLNALGTPLRREALAELLWPGAAPDASRRRLRTGLWRLRRALGRKFAHIVQQTQTHVWLRTGEGAATMVHTSYEASVTRICNAALDDVTQADFDHLTDLLPRGAAPVLQGIEADWVHSERTRFADLYLRGLDRQLTWYRREDRPRASISAAQTLLTHDPYREDIHAMLIGLYAATGQPRKAVAQFDACKDVLREDLGLDAKEARQALHAALLARDGPSPNRPTDLHAVLAGLEHSVRALTAQVDALRAALTDR